MRGSTHTQVLLEMAVVRLCRLGELISVGALIQMMNQPGVAVPVVAATAGTTASPRAAAPAAESGKKNDLTAGKSGGTSSTSEDLSTVPLTEATLRDVWVRFLQNAEEKSPILAKHLRFASSYAIFGPNSLAIRFPSGYAHAYDACASESGVQRIQDILRRVTGQTVTVRVEFDRTAVAPERNGNTAPSPPPAPMDKKKSLAALPLFKKASEALGAQIWHVDDDFNPTAPPTAPRAAKDEEAATDEG
jgi:DNA polymerase-3 subunit gamma/tau